MRGRFVRHTKPSVYSTLFEVDSGPGGARCLFFRDAVEVALAAQE
jgi:hypothetical protein